MIVLAFTLTSDCCDHLLYMRIASPIWKIKLLLQILISINICFVNALLCAGQGSGFDMLMNSLALLALNDIDNLIATLYGVVTGINVEGTEVTPLNRHDYFFSKVFSVPYMIWIFSYSLCFLGYIPITDPPKFIEFIIFIQSTGAIIFITIWYLICYSAYFAKYFEDLTEDDQNTDREQKCDEKDG